MDFLTNNMNLFVGGGSTAVALWVLKRIPNKKLYAYVERIAYCGGVAITLGLSKWKWTKKTWNKTIEPYLIDLIENTAGAFVKGMLKGLRKDN